MPINVTVNISQIVILGEADEETLGKIQGCMEKIAQMFQLSSLHANHQIDTVAEIQVLHNQHRKPLPDTSSQNPPDKKPSKATCKTSNDDLPKPPSEKKSYTRKENICVICHKRFIPGNPYANPPVLTCSPACRKIRHKESMAKRR